MRLYAAQGVRGVVIDLDTGLRVPRVIWYDTEAGELEAYRVIDDDYVRQLDGSYETYRARGRFEFRPRMGAQSTGRAIRTLHLGASSCALCHSKLTLLRDDLCAFCRAREKGRPFKLAVPLLDTKCCECSRTATWSTGDEVEATPERHGRRLYSRGATVNRRYFCDRHYRAPRVVDVTGDVITEIDVAARPQ